MGIIINIFSWVFSLNIFGLIILLMGVLSALFAIICFFAYLTKQSLDEHFDRYTIPYFIILLLTVPLILLTLLYKISLIVFIAVVCIGIALLIAYSEEQRLYPGYRDTFISKIFKSRSKRLLRREALKTAKSFIKPYSRLMGKHVLSNKYCQVIYNPNPQNGLEFLCISTKANSNNKYMFFEAAGMENKDWNEEFFNSLCQNFSYNTTLDNLYKLFTKYNFLTNDANYEKPTPKTAKQNEPTGKQSDMEEMKIMHVKEININEKFDIIDVNNATEAELTALPGINIIQAKKAIKHRDFEEEFKSIEDFISYLKIKPHFAKQLEKKITAEPKKQRRSKKLVKEERIVDLD